MHHGIEPSLGIERVAVAARWRLPGRRDRKHAMGMLVAVPLAAMLLRPSSVFAFTFSDGTSSQCIAAGRAVAEVDADPGLAVGFTGKTVDDAGALRIVWNRAKLDALPAVMHDYIFFHECAHLRVPTRDEIKANCVGLKDMRAAVSASYFDVLSIPGTEGRAGIGRGSATLMPRDFHGNGTPSRRSMLG